MSSLITQELARARHAEVEREIERAAAVRRAIAEREGESKESDRVVEGPVRAWLGRVTGSLIRTHRAAHA